MMRYLVKIVFLSVLLGVSIMMPAQDLPSLAKDGAITTGALANGISYYLVANSSMKGVADFALVRRGLVDTLSARRELQSLPHFNKAVPYKFLSRKGIGCTPEGYITYTDDATVFRFDDVPMFDQAASDTTLLMLFDLIAVQPHQHSIIIAGDINAGAIIQKMNVFALMVPSRNPSYKPKEYVWAHTGEMEHSFANSDRASVSIDFRSPRTPPELMNTIQPFIAELYSFQLAEIVECRLEDVLLARNVPASDVSAIFLGSDSGPGDEHFKVKIETSQDNLVPSTLALAATLSELGSKGVDEAEFKTSKETVYAEKLRQQDNSTLVGRCISSYLYGSDLASPASKINFLTSRSMDSKSEVALFNNYIYALLKQTDDSRLDWTGDEADYDDWFYPSLFTSTWNGVSMLEDPVYSWNVTAGDTLTLWSEKNKVKLKASGAEPVSGGQIWTFANGMKVIYKQTASKKTFDYSLMIKGGYSSVKNLHRGEGAFFSDMLSLYDVAGMTGTNFDRMLKANGIEMNDAVSVSDMRISGSAPSSKLNLLLKALLSVANDRTINPSAFDSYCKKEKAGLKTAFLDSLLYPDYDYSSVKTPSGLTPQTQALADSFFNDQFIRVNDGVLVLMGDLNAEMLQKTLSRYLGGFRVSKGTVIRPMVQYKLPSGTTTYSLESSPTSIDIAIAAAEPFSVENNMAFRVAVLALHRALIGVMAESGFSVSMTDRFKLNPQESMEVVFSCTPVPDYGLPLGVSGGSKYPMRALVAARKAIDDVLSKPISQAELSACKSLLSNCYSIDLSDQGNYVDAVLMRYSNGKDVLTNHQERINSVTAENVQKIFGVLSEGRRIEYVVKP